MAKSETPAENEGYGALGNDAARLIAAFCFAAVAEIFASAVGLEGWRLWAIGPLVFVGLIFLIRRRL